MTRKPFRLLVPFVVGCGGGTLGAFFTLWAQGRNADNVGAIVATVGTAVAVVGWYQFTRLQARAQTKLLEMQLLNEARPVLTRTLHVEQDRLRACSIPIHVFLSSGQVTPEQTNLAQTLRQAATDHRSTNWIFVLEEHEALFPETRTARTQLLMRQQRLHEELQRLSNVLVAATPLPRQFDAAAAELQGHIDDQSALLGDIANKIQNRAFGAVTGYSAKQRMPPDDRVPRLAMSADQLVIEVPDATRRVQMEIAGWLPPQNPPGS